MSAHQPAKPRVLVDANVLINVLLSPDPRRSAAAALLAEAERGTFSLVRPFEPIEVVERIAIEKPRLTGRIPPAAVEQLVAVLSRIAEVAPRLEVSPPRFVRDPGDDYLLAQALLADVDVLVTRDKDLLDIVAVGATRIVDPSTLLQHLRGE